MAMQETVFSIRVYFGLLGTFSLIRGVFGIIGSLQDVAFLIPALIGLFFGIGFLYSTIKLPELLRTSTKFVQHLLYVVAGIGALSAILAVVSGTYGADLISPVLLVMLAWYLLLNVRRLEEKHGIE